LGPCVRRLARERRIKGSHVAKFENSCSHSNSRHGRRADNGSATATDSRTRASHQHILCDDRAGESPQQSVRLPGVERVAGARALGQLGLGPLPSQSALFAAGDSDFPPDTVSKSELVLKAEGTHLALPHPVRLSWASSTPPLEPRHHHQIARTKWISHSSRSCAGPDRFRNRVAFEETLS
jgi:hypothetical protein